MSDPNPPAFLRGSQMRVGNGQGAGLENAAEQSPALRLCGPEGGDGDDGVPSATAEVIPTSGRARRCLLR